jgi:para-nitrobenzyl esterase
VGTSLFTRLGVSSLFDARALPWLTIIQAELSNYPNGDYKDAYGPIVDGRYMKQPMEASIKAGLANDVPFMGGANSGDMPGLITGLQEQMPWRVMFNKAPQYVYKFSKVPSGWAAQGVLSYHGGELTYVFNYPASLATHFMLNLVLDPATNMRVAVADLNGDGVSGSMGDIKDVLASANFGAEDSAVADSVMSMWTNFAKAGDPSTGTFAWMPYTAASDAYAEIAATPTMKTGLMAAFSEVQARAPAGTANQAAP